MVRASTACSRRAASTRVSLAAMAAVIALTSAPALAQIEEIVVTARRKEESLQQTPISVTAFSEQELERLSASDITDIAKAAPNVDLSFTVGTSGGANAQATIRGIGQTDFLITTDPGVGIYVDGVYLGRTTGSVLDLLDVERVEILRGPQGTLFGRNTIGGAINVVTQDPTPELSAYGQATTGRFNRFDAEFGVGGQILADRLSARISLARRDRDGYAERVLVDEDLGDVEEYVGRAKAELRVTDTFNILFSADATFQNANSTAIELAAVNPQASILSLWNPFVGAPQGLEVTPADVDPDDDPFTTRGTGPNVNETEIYGVSATATWDLNPNLEIKSISAYRTLQATFGRDGDNTPAVLVHTENDVFQWQVSQELQLLGDYGRFDWVAGLYYYREHAEDRNSPRLGAGLFNALENLPTSLDNLATGMFDAPQTPGVPGGPGNPINVLLDLELDVFNQIDTTSYAVFGETSIELTSKLSAFVGGRYTLDDKEYFLEHIRLNAGVPIIPATTVEDDFSAFSGRVGLEYAWTDTVFLYGSASRGFKSGGFNGRPTSSAEISSFDPEFLTTIEAGVKSDLFNDRLRLNVAGFYSFYDDIQLQVRTLDEQSGTFVEVIANAGEARIGGLEVQGTFAPTQSLLFNGNLSYLHDEYRDIGSAGAVGVQEDNELPRSPAITAGFGGQYTAPFFGFGEITFRADYFYKGEYFQDTINTEAIKEDGYSLVNARVSWLSPDERWNVAAFGTNIFDAEYIENGGSALDSFGTAELVPGRPAEWGLTLGFRF